jgi:hypothetical protein
MISLRCHTILCYLRKLLKTPLELICMLCKYFLCYISFNVLRVFKPSPFSVDLILRNKKKSGGDKSGEYGGDLILE